MSDKNVSNKRKSLTISEKLFVKGIVQNLSLLRWTDEEIVNYLQAEKAINIGRSTVTVIRNEIEKEAETWYLDLQRSRYKYIAIYKERLDSLLSYQKKLHEIIADTNKEEVKIKAISELHSIEMSILNLLNGLPTFKSELIELLSKNYNSGNNHTTTNATNHEELLNMLEFNEEAEDEAEPSLAAHRTMEGIQCLHCKRWFKDKLMMDIHQCSAKIK
jgi:hypothetical protein